MAKMNKKQKTQFIFLAVLSVVLVIVIYWQYLLSPIMKECGELSSSIDENEIQLMNTMMTIGDMSVDIDENEALLKSIAEQTADLYPIINTDDADIIILKYISDCGLSASTLAIASSEPSAAGTGIFTINAEYGVSGSYKQLRALIEKLNTEPAICITGIAAAAEGKRTEVLEITHDGPATVTHEEPASEENMDVVLAISLYMYEAPVIPEYFKPEAKDDEDGIDEFFSPDAFL